MGLKEAHLPINTLCCCAFVLLSSIDFTRAAEWLTSKGEHCLDRCSDHGRSFNWCHTTDPATGVYSRGNGKRNGKWEWVGQGDHHLKWDYCVPQQHGTVSQSTRTALNPPTACTSPCQRTAGARSTCKTETSQLIAEITPQGDTQENNEKWFYCAEETPLKRSQLTATEMLWCIDSCRRDGQRHYWCNTMYGPDYCSPSREQSTKGIPCIYPCEKRSRYNSEDYYFCYTRPDNSSWEYCGFFDVPEKKKTKLEFTENGFVCADFCRKKEDHVAKTGNARQGCHYVYWNYSESLQQATLTRSWHNCGHPGAEEVKLLITMSLVLILSALSVAFLLCLCLYCCCVKQRRMGRRNQPTENAWESAQYRQPRARQRAKPMSESCKYGMCQSYLDKGKDIELARAPSSTKMIDKNSAI